LLCSTNVNISSLHSRGESGWCSEVTSIHGAWRHARVRFLLSGIPLGRLVARRRDNWPGGVTDSTLDSESSDRGSNPRGAFPIASNLADRISGPSFSSGIFANGDTARCTSRNFGASAPLPNVTSAAWNTFDNVPMEQNAMAGACRLGVGYCKQAGRARFRKDRELGRQMSSCACVAGWPVNRPITKAMNQVRRAKPGPSAQRRGARDCCTRLRARPGWPWQLSILQCSLGALLDKLSFTIGVP
jgi:hypothetical protein